MNVTAAILANKIREIHPALDRYGISLRIAFDDGKDAWIVHLRKDGNELWTHINAVDAAKCLDGIECVHLGVQIGQFVNYYCDGPVAACAA